MLVVDARSSAFLEHEKRGLSPGFPTIRRTMPATKIF